MKKLLIVPAVAVGMLALGGCDAVVRTTPVRADATAPASAPDVIVLGANSPKLGRIRVDAVALHEFPVDEVIAPGKVEANPNRISKLTLPAAGRIRAVYVRLGDAVRQGQALVALDSADAGAAIAALRQSQSQVRMSRSALAKAEADLARVRELHEHKAAALKDVLAAENDRAQAVAALEQASTAETEARHRIELLGLNPNAPAPEVAVRAPLAGKILDISVVPGEYRNDTATPLMTIADLRTVWIGADVPESQIRLIGRGEAVEVRLSAYPDEVFHARVMRIADVVDPQTRTVKVQAEIDNPGGRLRPEMFGRIRHTHAARPLPAVPSGALVELEGRSVAMVETVPGTFRQTPVTAGARQGDLVAIAAGLKAGDRVVVDGAMLLRKD
jgi:cobalt-zinc-cadmium efflux system membrane fusion protein